MVAATNRLEDYFVPNTVSRRHGLQLRTNAVSSTAGQLATVNLLKADGTMRKLDQSTVVGKHRFTLPIDFVDGDVVQVMFDQDKVVSPSLGELRAKWSEFQWCVTNMHAIEK